MSDITINAHNRNNWQRSGTTATLRIWFTGQFRDSNGVMVDPGNGTSTFYKIVSCTVNPSTHVLSVPSFILPSTLDAIPTNIQINGQMYDASGAAREFLWNQWSLSNLPLTINFADWFIFNQGSSLANPNEQFLNSQEIMTLITSLTQGMISETPAGLVNGVNGTFTLSQTPVLGSLQLFLNGILQPLGNLGAGTESYTLSGATITHYLPPQTGDRLFAVYRAAIGLVGGGAIPTQIQESGGPTVLTMGSVPDGNLFRRSGASVIGVPNTLPSAGQQSALAGTLGTPSGTNKYVTDADLRLAVGTAAIIQPNDPAITSPSIVVAGSLWVDTNGGSKGLRFKVRNAANTAWLTAYWDVPFDARFISGMVLNLTVQDFLGISNGATISTWADSSGNGNNATLQNAGKPGSFIAADDEVGLPYISAPYSGGGGGFTVPIPATTTKTVFMVVQHFGTLPLTDSAPLRFNVNSEILGTYDSLVYAGYQTSGSTSTAGFGYISEWSVLCWRQNGLTVDLYYNGTLAVTFTLFAASSTSSMLMNEVSNYRQVVMFSSTLTSAQVATYSDWLQRFWTVNYKVSYLSATGTLNQTIFLQKKGLVGLRPLVIFNHAAGETERMWRDLPAFRTLVNACVETGYVVMFSRQHGDSWGNNNSLADNETGYNYAVANLSADPNKVAMVGDSMGGVPAMLSFPLTAIPLKGAALYWPVEDVAYQHDFNAAMGTTIDAAYPPNFATSGSGHNPVSRSASDWSGKRFIWFGSTLDTVVPYTQNTAAMRTLINSVATENTFTELNADHNTPSAIASTRQALLDFLARCFA